MKKLTDDSIRDFPQIKRLGNSFSITYEDGLFLDVSYCKDKKEISLIHKYGNFSLRLTGITSGSDDIEMTWVNNEIFISYLSSLLVIYKKKVVLNNLMYSTEFSLEKNDWNYKTLQSLGLS